MVDELLMLVYFSAYLAQKHLWLLKLLGALWIEVVIRIKLVDKRTATDAGVAGV